MQDLPRLFNEKGELINVDVAGLDAPTRARHTAVVTAYHAHVQAQGALTAAYADVDHAVLAVKNTEEFFDAHWPKQTFHDLWRETFGPQTRR
jgi:hypothetical protein